MPSTPVRIDLGAFSVSLSVRDLVVDPDGNPVRFDQHVRPARLTRPAQAAAPGSFGERTAPAAACSERSASSRIPMSSRYTGSGIRSTGETV